jgi:hypothetical protein
MDIGHEFNAHICDTPTVEISDNIVHVRFRSGQVRAETTMSVRLLTKSVARANRALERYAAGEQNIIVDD